MSQSNLDEAMSSYSVEDLGRTYETGAAPDFQDERHSKPIHSDQTRSIDEFELLSDRSTAHRPYTSSLGMVTDVGTATSAHSLDDDFVSTRSYKSKTTYYTAASRYGDQDPGQKRTQFQLHQESEYMRILAKKNLWPIDPFVEQNWSGLGQHVEFRKDERKLVEQLLEVNETLGKGSAAIVQSVKCRRILLARKTIFCNRNLTKDEAIDEVAHLTRLSHSHIVRPIGTYTLGKELSILIYPVAEQNLEEFLVTFSRSPSDNVRWGMQLSMEKFLVCLSDTLNYIHSTLVKHMDIKPQNLLVRSLQNAPPGDYSILKHKIYFADFGISRSYQWVEDVETDGPSDFTRKYAAPEVIEQESRGFPADVFSLGCVFLEIIASFYDSFQHDQYCFTHFVRGNWQPANIQSASKDLQAILDTNSGGLRYYYANVDRLKDYFASRYWNCTPSVFPEGTVPLIERMLSFDPEARPTPQQLVDHFGKSRCCSTGPEALEALEAFTTVV